MSEIEVWLRSAGLGHCAAAFVDHKIDAGTLADLTESDLKELGLTIGDRKRFRRAMDTTRAGRDHSPGSKRTGIKTDQVSGARHAEPERRHITVMFCDIVGSTPLSEQLETEDYLEVIRAYREHCIESVAKFEGFVARFVGDGVLCYFGHPTAHENDAERAIHAALDIIRSIDKVRSSPLAALQVRIGIASGSVIVGDLFTSGVIDKDSIVGATPNLAAHIQAFAPPNGIVISDSTYRLVKASFICRRVAAPEQASFTSTTLWRVVTERALRIRPRQSGARRLAPLVNRSAEIVALDGLWLRSRSGYGGGLLIVGEAAIGKSRLVEDFLRRQGRRNTIVIELVTSSFDQTSALGPVIGYIQRAAHFRTQDDGRAKVAKLESLLLGDDREKEDALSVCAALLSIAAHENRSLEFTPRQLKERFFELISDQFRRMTEIAPVVLVVEDLHWLDPTSLELLLRVLQDVQRRRAMVIMTCREIYDREWAKAAGVEILELSRLQIADCKAILQSIAGAGALDADIQHQILEKCDGVPLFVEELTLSVLDGTVATSSSGRDVPLKIPASLHESLLARLDRAGQGRALAQIASVIGRSIPREHLIRVAQWDEDMFEAALERLVDSDLFQVEIAEGAPAYVFRHALVQDAAYDSLLRDRRRELHARTASVLIELRPDIAEQQPELLAHHLTEANLCDEAVSYWLRASQRDVARSALQEAMAHLRRGLSVLDMLTETPLNLERRLQFLALLGPVLIALKGPGSTEVEDAYAVAFEICRRIPETKSHFAINWGWWRLSRNFTTMRQRSRELLAQAQARQDEELLLQAHHCEWASHFNQANLRACHEHIDAGLEIYARGDFRSHATLYGNHDAKVCGHGERALVLWMQGQLDRALEEERRSLAWANELMHSGSLAHANDIALMHRFYRRDAAAVLSRADAMIRFAEDRGFSDHKAKALIFRGWAMAQMGDPISGLETLEIGLARQKDIGTIEDFPPFFCMYAETLSLCGRPEVALAELLAARELFNGVELKVWEPEVCRCTGELLRLTEPQNTEAAEREFEAGLNAARAQGAHVLELRSATSLARFWDSRGEAERSVQLLTSYLNDRDPSGGPEAQEGAALLARLSAGASVLVGKGR